MKKYKRYLCSYKWYAGKDMWVVKRFDLIVYAHNKKLILDRICVIFDEILCGEDRFNFIGKLVSYEVLKMNDGDMYMLPKYDLGYGNYKYIYYHNDGSETTYLGEVYL